jgi:hypothetical protein
MSDGLKISIGVKETAANSGNPALFNSTLHNYMVRAVREGERVMRKEAPKALSTLTNSIRGDQVGEFEWIISPHTNYGRMVALGTGQGGGYHRYYPGGKIAQANLEAWLNKRPATGKAVTMKERLRALTWHIYIHGTKPNPYHERAAAEMKSRVEDLLERGVIEGLRAAFHGTPGAAPA